MRTGKYERAYELLAPLPEEARRLGAERLALSLTVELGVLQQRRGRSDEVLALLRHTVFELDRRGMFKLAFEASQALAADAGCQRLELDEAKIWEDLAEALLYRMGSRAPTPTTRACCGRAAPSAAATTSEPRRARSSSEASSSSNASTGTRARSEQRT